MGNPVRSQSTKPRLARIKSRGISIEAVPFFSLDAAGWKAKAFVWRHAAEPVEQFVNDRAWKRWPRSTRACFWDGRVEGRS